MEEELPSGFSVLQQKKLRLSAGESVLDVCYNPAVDVVGISTNRSLSVFRVLTWERIWTKILQVQCLSWRPDGRFLSCISPKGIMHVFCLESGKEVEVLRFKDAMNLRQQTVSSTWKIISKSQAELKKGPKILLEAVDHFERYPTKMLPCPDYSLLLNGEHDKCDLVSGFLCPNEENLQFNIQWITTKNSQIHFYIQGVIHAGIIDAASNGFGNEHQRAVLVSADLSLDLSCLACVAYIDSDLKLILVDTSSFSKFYKQLEILSGFLLHFEKLLQTLKKGVDEMNLLFRALGDAVLELIQPLEDALNYTGSDHSIQEELKVLLIFGVSTEALREAFDLEQKNSKLRLQKLRTILKKSFEKLISLATKVVIRTVDQMATLMKHILFYFSPQSEIPVLLKCLETAEGLSISMEIVFTACYTMCQQIGEFRTDYLAVVLWFEQVLRHQELSELKQDEKAFEELLCFFKENPLMQNDYSRIKDWINGIKEENTIAKRMSFPIIYSKDSTHVLSELMAKVGKVDSFRNSLMDEFSAAMSESFMPTNSITLARNINKTRRANLNTQLTSRGEKSFHILMQDQPDSLFSLLRVTNTLEGIEMQAAKYEYPGATRICKFYNDATFSDIFVFHLVRQGQDYKKDQLSLVSLTVQHLQPVALTKDLILCDILEKMDKLGPLHEVARRRYLDDAISKDIFVTPEKSIVTVLTNQGKLCFVDVNEEEETEDEVENSDSSDEENIL